MSGFINTAVPDKEFRKNVLLEHIGSRSFCFLYNFESKTTEIYIPGGDSYAIIRDIESSIPGLSFAELPKHREEKTRSTTLMSFYKRMEEHEVKELDDIFGIDISTGKMRLA